MKITRGQIVRNEDGGKGGYYVVTEKGKMFNGVDGVFPVKGDGVLGTSGKGAILQSNYLRQVSPAKAWAALKEMQKPLTSANLQKATGTLLSPEYVQRLKEQDAIALEKGQKPVYTATLEIEWTKSRTWGTTCIGSARVVYSDGNIELFRTGRISGCGYDKHSTAVAQLLNQFLLGELWRITPARRAANNARMRREGAFYIGHSHQNDTERYPYAFQLSGDYRRWSGAIGMECYPRAIQWLGGEMKHTADGKWYDAWQITFKKNKPKK